MITRPITCVFAALNLDEGWMFLMVGYPSWLQVVCGHNLEVAAFLLDSISPIFLRVEVSARM